MERYSKKVEEIMSSAGWTPKRNIGISDYIHQLENEGYIVFNEVKFFLRNFGGLQIEFENDGSLDNIHFNISQSIGQISKEWIIDDYSNKVGEKLCLIGQAYRGYMVLSMSKKGGIYAGYDDLLYLVGKGVHQGIENLLLRKKPFTPIN